MTHRAVRQLLKDQRKGILDRLVRLFAPGQSWPLAINRLAAVCGVQPQEIEAVKSGRRDLSPSEIETLSRNLETQNAEADIILKPLVQNLFGELSLLAPPSEAEREAAVAEWNLLREESSSEELVAVSSFVASEPLVLLALPNAVTGVTIVSGTKVELQIDGEKGSSITVSKAES